MISQNKVLQKCIFGLKMLLIVCIICSLLLVADHHLKTNFFLFGLFILILLFIFSASQEILNLIQKSKKILKIWILIFFYIVFGFCFISLTKMLINSYSLCTDQKMLNHPFYKYIYNFISDFEHKWIYKSFGITLFLFFLLFLFMKDFNIDYFVYCLFNFFYIVFFSACFYSLVFYYLPLFFYILFIAISTDSFAFIGGRLWGKHLLCPYVSPKKTWEGFFLGIIITLILAVLIRFLWINKKPTIDFIWINKKPTIDFILLIVGSSIVVQLGDLIASKIKRYFRIKDFSNLLPGHGGLIDRFDSLLFLSFFLILYVNFVC